MIINKKHPSLYLFLIFSSLLRCPPSSAVDFIFNSFNSTSVSRYGNAIIQSNILTLTSPYPYQIGRALYPQKITMKKASSLLPFSTSFIFAMVPARNLLPGHGFVFLFTPDTGIQETSGAEYHGLFSRTVDGNSSNHMFGVEFDVFRNEEFGDIDGNHVGIDVNSVTSVISHTAGYYPDGGRDFATLKLNDGRNYQVWIKYMNFTIDVSMAPVGEKPGNCLICNAPLNLSDVFEDEMYVGFSAATGTLSQSHNILSWSFSNSDNVSWSDGLITEGLPSLMLPSETNNRSTGFIVGLPLGIFIVVVMCGVVGFVWINSKKRLAKAKAEMEEDLDQMPGMPTRFSYEELKTATEDFSKKLGEGGFGSVFEGSLKDGSKIAVKCLEGLSHIKKSFLAEVQSIGSIHHVNLVRLRGFCSWKSQRFLVYDFMSNGSLEKWIYHGNREHILDWKCRKKIILDIAKGLAYLHEECRQKIIHLDIKPQNILLDDDFNAKVSDFGLSKLMDRNQSQVMTTMRGTPGYLAPEWLSSVITEKVDVYSFGIVLLEILCGRKNFDRSQPEEKWHLLRVFEKCWEQETLLDMVDMNSEDMQINGTEVVEMMKMVSWCLQTDYTRRPSMSLVVKVLEGGTNVGSDLDYNFADPKLQQSYSQDKDSTPLWPSVLSGPR
ncbi:hypothetical protein L1987_61551 [Smallanthus sonchifolius]|uniref:Uncharacterized protein n=1 Tax=Smallanthus sonchifolius TaxID=185202 RepID=A0ACB9C7W8_9ASTR|nr:hypothetical protein L1987_61551 [Smallanthus sonchifolius]